MIDAYLLKHPESAIPLTDEVIDDQFVNIRQFCIEIMYVELDDNIRKQIIEVQNLKKLYYMIKLKNKIRQNKENGEY